MSTIIVPDGHVEVVAEVHADEPADRRRSRWTTQHPGERVGQHPGDGGRDDQRRGDQGDADDVSVARIASESTSISSASMRAMRTPDDVGHLGVERGEQQGPVADEDHAPR